MRKLPHLGPYPKKHFCWRLSPLFSRSLFSASSPWLASLPWLTSLLWETYYSIEEGGAEVSKERIEHLESCELDGSVLKSGLVTLEQGIKEQASVLIASLAPEQAEPPLFPCPGYPVWDQPFTATLS